MERKAYTGTIFFTALMLLDALLFLNVLMFGGGGYINESNKVFAESVLKIFPYLLYGLFVSLIVESIHTARRKDGS